MTKRLKYPDCLALLILLVVCFFAQPLMAQTSEVTVKGTVTESGTGLPLKQVSISVTSTGVSSETDETGAFTISVPDYNAELIINLPGYVKKNVFLNGRETFTVALVPDKYKTFDNQFNTPLGPEVVKNESYAFTALNVADFSKSASASFDQMLQGKVPGMHVIEQSGMPGHRTYMQIRGINSLYGSSEPLLFIDGMIHDFSYAKNSLMEGFALNPFDIVDIDDISDITVLNDGLSYLGAAGSNGVINVNTEQKAEASTIIKFQGYQGISMAPKTLDVMNPSQYKGYFTDMLSSQGYTGTEIDNMYPWLNGSSSVKDYYKYNNNTDWQNEIFQPANLQKYHFFLKGGDDIATYNISTGFLNQKGLFEDTRYNRFNLRINGKINITDKFSVTPNAKLSLADNYLPNLGYSAWKNPILSSLLLPPIMAANARDEATGLSLPYLDDTGVFDASNPVAIIKNARGSDRNYHFLSSINAQYKFNEHFNLSTLIGIDFNNSRENIFLPSLGLIQVDSSENSPGDQVNEYRSTQNHTVLTYTNRTASGHSILFNGGLRYMKNQYKFDRGIDLNTPSDDFKSLGQGSKYNFLRTNTGDNRDLTWISWFGNLKYSFRDRYFIDANASVDGNSAVNKNNRYNVYPSVAAAWRLSSESFMNSASWLEDFKLRGSYSVTGNMFSSVYDYSKLYYTSRRLNNIGVLTREAIPNDNLALEKKNTIDGGLDFSILKQGLNLHVDIYKSTVNNLVIEQTLPSVFGFTNYFDNGGKMEVTGMEVAADIRLHFGELVWTLGGSVSKEANQVTALDFLDKGANKLITYVKGAEYITSVGNPINAFYGYKTNGLISADESGIITGPKGAKMQQGDVKFVDLDGNGIINNADKTIIGDPNADMFGCISTGFEYKNFELSAFFNYSLGNDVFNYVRYQTESMNSYNNQSTSVLDRWTSTNTGATMPRASFGDPTGNTVFSDRWIEDGSYLRLKQLSVSYSLPPVTGVYKGITIFLTGTNLLTFTKYTGYDPDFQYINSPFYMGIDYGKIPQTKSFVIGIKLDL
jgi:TonB-linked SusC/RagA family outer membrane protein